MSAVIIKSLTGEVNVCTTSQPLQLTRLSNCCHGIKKDSARFGSEPRNLSLWTEGSGWSRAEGDWDVSVQVCSGTGFTGQPAVCPWFSHSSSQLLSVCFWEWFWKCPFNTTTQDPLRTDSKRNRNAISTWAKWPAHLIHALQRWWLWCINKHDWKELNMIRHDSFCYFAAIFQMWWSNTSQIISCDGGNMFYSLTMNWNRKLCSNYFKTKKSFISADIDNTYADTERINSGSEWIC